MEVEIKNCNNIEKGNIEIKENSLNIKYAINGTGKTTIAKAIRNKILNEDLNILKPFKYQNNKEIVPQIEGIDIIKSVKLFNEEYVNQYVFLRDEVVKSSFEIFIKNEEYEKEMKYINELLADIKNVFIEDDNLNELVSNLKELSSSFGKSKSGYAANSVLNRGLGNGNKIENIPEELKEYSNYLRSDVNSKWLKWQLSGKEYLDISNVCPYCTSNTIEENKSKINALSEQYDAKVIEHLNKILEVFSKLNAYFSDEVKNKISIITKNIDGISPEQENFLLEVKSQIEVLIEKLEKLKNIGFITLKDSDKIIEMIRNYKIDMEYLQHLNSKETRDKVSFLNQKIEVVLKKAGELQGKINKQKENISNNIKEYDNEINSFLKCAGINYHVSIELDEDNVYRMKLKHNDLNKHITDPKLFLSYGEKNAFALILFMYEAINSKTDLIILDDPISSFDKNKKFAIINNIFRGKNSLMNKTVLMLTHDFEPIIDMKYVLPDKFNCNAKFIENKNGILNEKQIKKCNIHTFLEIAKENINKLDNTINKLIYIRRYYEIKNKSSLVYHLVSSLFHKREIPTIESEKRELTKKEIELAVQELINENNINSFDYQEEYNKIIDDKKMIDIYNSCNNNYEKLQIYRIINDGKNINDDIIKKFMNETFHIENDYLFQLNPCEYEIIPEYIIEQCDKNILEISKESN
jgi:ABC-type Mn2+/Zn2+ transport system ATPase subunit